MENQKKTMSQVEYHIEQFENEKKELIKEQASEKVDEFVSLLTKQPVFVFKICY